MHEWYPTHVSVRRRHCIARYLNLEQRDVAPAQIDLSGTQVAYVK